MLFCANLPFRVRLVTIQTPLNNAIKIKTLISYLPTINNALPEISKKHINKSRRMIFLFSTPNHPIASTITLKRICPVIIKIILPESDNGLFTVIAANNTVNAPGIPPKYNSIFILLLFFLYSHIPKGSYRANNSEALLQAVLQGIGIALLPHFITQTALSNTDKKLIPILTRFDLPEHFIYAVYPDKKNLPRKITLFVDFLKEQFGVNSDYQHNIEKE